MIAVLSLAIQLGDNARKLHNFWNSIQNGPQEIHNIRLDLEFLASVFEQIHLEAQQQRLPDPLMESTLRLCSEKIEMVVSLTNDLEPGFSSSKLCVRKWNAFRAALRRKKLRELQKSLDRMKDNLVLVKLNSVG